MLQNDGKFVKVLNRIADLVGLNLLAILFCIPIVTIGASITAVYGCIFRIQEKKEGYNPEALGDVVKNESWYGGNYSMEKLWEGNAGKMAGGAPTFSMGDGKFLLKKYTAYYVNDEAADNMGNKEGKANNVRVMRFAEVLLMYAEACAKTNDVTGASYALKLIRERAGLADKTFTQDQLMDQIEHQCLLEFFGEGHRFDDLKRWYTTNEIKTILKANDKQGADNFQERNRYYPIPTGELNNNSAMQQIDLWK